MYVIELLEADEGGIELVDPSWCKPFLQLFFRGGGGARGYHDHRLRSVAKSLRSKRIQRIFNVAEKQLSLWQNFSEWTLGWNWLTKNGFEKNTFKKGIGWMMNSFFCRSGRRSTPQKNQIAAGNFAHRLFDKSLQWRQWQYWLELVHHLFMPRCILTFLCYSYDGYNTGNARNTRDTNTVRIPHPAGVVGENVLEGHRLSIAIDYLVDF